MPSGKTTKPISFPTVAISHSSGGALFVYGTGPTGQSAGPQVCGLQTGFSCTGDVSLLFVGPVSDLKFSGFFASDSDRATIAAYADDTLLSFILVSGNANGQVGIDFSGVSGITRVEIGDLSSRISRGIAYGDFSFDVDPPGPPAPLPAPLGLSFDALSGGVNGPSLDLGPALLTTDAGQLFVYRTGDFGMAPNGGFCAYTTASDCLGDFTLDFRLPVYDLTFAGYFAKLTDGAVISLFDGDVMIYNGRHAGSTGGTIRFDFRQFASITRVLIRDDSNPVTKGIAYGSFRFRDVPAVAPIPVPASSVLLLAALGLLALLGVTARRRALRGLACMAVLCLPAIASAQTAGEVVEVTPQAEAVTNGVARALVRGGAVASGDLIRTGAGGRVQLLFTDETKIVVGPKSTLRLDETLFRGNGSAQKFSTAALGGTFRFISGGSPKRVYKLATPVATMGIRGTVFDYTVTAGEATDLLVLDGEVRFCARGARCVVVPGGCQAVTANSDGTFTQPLTEDEKRALLLRRFPLLASQNNLLPPFRAGTAGCQTVKLIALPGAIQNDREDGDDDGNPADGPSEGPGGGGNPAE